MRDTPAIHTTELGKRFGSNWALQDCSVSVPPGHVTALVGPNGAGKTTLLKLLVGLCAPSAGEAEVLGRVPDQSEEFLASIGYLAQDVPLYKRLSAERPPGDRRPPQSRLGCRCRPGTTRRTENPDGPTGRDALGRPARPGWPEHGLGEAASAPPPRRADGRVGPVGSSGVLVVPHLRRRR